MFLRTLLVLPLALAAPSNPTTITLSASAAASTPSEYADTSAFKSAVLNSTNTYRAQHNASALSWNTSLATFAANWGRACVFEHSVRLFTYLFYINRSSYSPCSLVLASHAMSVHIESWKVV
jgi:hypothetical protein